VTPTDALRSGFALLRDRTRDTLTLYLVAAGAVFAARVPLLLALGVAVAVLAAQGRIAPVVREFEAFSRQVGEGGFPTADPTATPDLPPGLQTAIEGLVTPTTALLFVAGLLLTLLAALVAQAAGAAVTISGIRGALDDEDPVRAGLSGLSRTGTFLGVWLVRVALLGLVTLALLVVGGLAASLGPAGALVAGLAVLVWLAAVAVVLLALAFAGQAVVVDEVGVFGAVRRSLGFPVREPFGFLVYLVVAVVGYGGFGVLSLLLGAFGVPRVGALVALLVVAPIVDGFKTALYAERPLPAVGGSGAAGGTGDEWNDPPGVSDGDDEWNDPPGVGPVDAPAGARAGDEAAAGDDAGARLDPATSDSPAGDSPGTATGTTSAGTTTDTADGGVLAALRRGVAALRRFVVEHPGANLAGLALLAVGVVGGWLTTSGVGVQLATPADVAGVFGGLGVAATPVFVNIAANNWFVALTGAFGGLALGVPTATTMLFNGFVIGALAGLFDPTAFLALVAPHGVVELPAIAVSGGVGLHLGRVGWRAWRGSLPLAAAADELREAYDVLLGLLVVLLVAAFVEAFLTPLLASQIIG
jgi:uncharacterized membrane protein SpoIIM required for sporulation